jgi:hypothetical protein
MDDTIFRVRRVPCHHGMARPRMRMERSPPSMEGSCEYIEAAVADSRQGVVLQLGGWAWGRQLLTVKILYCHEMFQSASDLD